MDVLRTSSLRRKGFLWLVHHTPLSLRRVLPFPSLPKEIFSSLAAAVRIDPPRVLETGQAVLLP